MIICDQRGYGALNKAVDIVNSESFIEDLRAEKDKALQTTYDYSVNTRHSVNNVVIESLKKKNIFVSTYKPWWPWSKALAYFSPKTPDRIFLNSRKLNRSVESIVGSIVHEVVHLVDYSIPTMSFDHGNNNPKGKQFTAPYYIGRVARNVAIRFVS